MFVTIIVMVFFVLMIFIQFYNPKPISKFDFGVRVIASMLLLVTVWIFDDPNSRIFYKFLLSGMALVSAYAAYVQYRKGVTKSK